LLIYCPPAVELLTQTWNLQFVRFRWAGEAHWSAGVVFVVLETDGGSGVGCDDHHAGLSVVDDADVAWPGVAGQVVEEDEHDHGGQFGGGSPVALASFRT
jgi:hypothetical protein